MSLRRCVSGDASAALGGTGKAVVPVGMGMRQARGNSSTNVASASARSHGRSGFARATLALLLLTACGCRQIETRFDVLSFKNQDNPEQYTEHFEAGWFSIDAQNNWDIVFEIPPTTVELVRPSPTTSSPDSQPADAPARPTKTEVTMMSQLVHIRVFWRPLPGTTYAESSQTDASILYCLITGEDAISYEGAGFVYFTLSYDKQTITGQVESATLVPVRMAGVPVDLFGPCRLQAYFVAHQDRRRVVSILQQVRKSLGRPVAPMSEVFPPGGSWDYSRRLSWGGDISGESVVARL